MVMTTEEKIQANKGEAAQLRETRDEEKRTERWASRQKANQEKTDLQADLEREYNIEAGTTIAHNLFHKAWSDGHSYGLPSVRAEYEELVELFYKV